MAKVKVIENQSLLDIAIQVYGSVEAVFALALDNDLSITDIIIPGTELEYKSSNILQPEVVRNYSNKNINPATALSPFDLIKPTLFEAGLFATGLFE